MQNQKHLREKKEIQGLFKYGTRIRIRNVCIVYMKNEIHSTRYLITTSRTCGSKPIRNRIKRIVSTILTQVSLASGFRFAVVLQPIKKSDIHTRYIYPCVIRALTQGGIIAHE